MERDHRSHITTWLFDELEKQRPDKGFLHSDWTAMVPIIWCDGGSSHIFVVSAFGTIFFFRFKQYPAFCAQSDDRFPLNNSVMLWYDSWTFREIGLQTFPSHSLILIYLLSVSHAVHTCKAQKTLWIVYYTRWCCNKGGNRGVNNKIRKLKFKHFFF